MSGSLTVGLAYNVKRVDVFVSDADAEYDSPKTIESIRKAIESSGHRVEMIEATPDMISQIPGLGLDLVFNIAEGARGRNREAHVPAICEFLGIEYTGSDVATQCICLDKMLSKKLMKCDGVKTPEFFLISRAGDKIPKELRYPLIVKPNAEGSSKGIGPQSVVDNENSLRGQVAALVEKYKQPVIVEEYITGREITVGLVGWPEPRVLPIMEVVFLQSNDRPVYSYDLKQEWDGKLEYKVPAMVGDAERNACETIAMNAFKALGCRDIGRVDIRMTKDGTPYVIEVNPLPGLTPNYSDLIYIAEAAGMDQRALIGEILSCGISRLNSRK
jgi:D-alanine--D-alanine ligase